MMGQQRPNGRRLLLGGLGALVAAAAAPAAAMATDQVVDIQPNQAMGETLGAAPDGGLWSTPSYGGVVRVSPDGRVRTFELARLSWSTSLTPLTPLDDGSMGIVTAGWTERGDQAAVVRVRADGSFTHRVLPDAVLGTSGAILAPGGTVWTARSCADSIMRIAPDGSVRGYRLRPLGCRHVDEWVAPQNAQTLRRGVDGSTWIVNQCQGRIARIDRHDRVREWRVRSACSEDESARVQPTRVLVEAAGGLRLDGVRLTAGGAIRSSADIVVPDVVTADGSEWSIAGAGEAIRQLAPDGRERVVALGGPAGPRYAWSVAAGADGRLWLVAGEQPRESPAPRFQGRLFFGAIAGDGSLSIRPAPGDPAPLWRAFAPQLATGGDGRAWISERAMDTPPDYHDYNRLVGFETGAQPARSRARVTRVLERDGSRLWLQLSCDAAAGRFCSGRVGIADRRARVLLRRPVRYLLAGGSREGIVVSLSRASLPALRRGPLRARVTLAGDRAGSATTTQTIKVPR